MFLVGISHRHVKTHEPFGRLENNGGSQKSGRVRSTATGQLHRPHPGGSGVSQDWEGGGGGVGK